MQLRVCDKIKTLQSKITRFFKTALICFSLFIKEIPLKLLHLYRSVVIAVRGFIHLGYTEIYLCTDNICLRSLLKASNQKTFYKSIVEKGSNVFTE